MKILDRYIARQLLGVTALGVMALSALLLLGNLFKELRPLLVENKAPISIVLEFIFQVIPFSLMFSIPWGFLTAVLLVYGRLASDNELTSMRMSGMSLWRLSAPAIAIGIALSGLCYWINIDIAPRAKQSISELLIKAASINPKGLLNEGQAITKLDNLEIYIDKRVDDVIHGMHIYQKADDKSPSVAMHSERVTMDFSPEKKILTLHLINPLITTQEEGSISQSVTMDEMPLASTWTNPAPDASRPTASPTGKSGKLWTRPAIWIKSKPRNSPRNCPGAPPSPWPASSLPSSACHWPSTPAEKTPPQDLPWAS